MAWLLSPVQAVVFVGLSIDGPTGFTSKAGLAGTQFPWEQRMRPPGFHLLTRSSPKPRRRPREPGVRDGSREIRPLPVAAAVAIAVAPMAITIRAVAVGGIAVVAVRGLAVAIPAAISISAIAIAIGGGLGGGEAGCAERGGGGDRDEGLLERIHVHFSKRVSNRVARPTRTTWHRHERLNIGQTPFRFGGVPPQLQSTTHSARPRPPSRLSRSPSSPAPPQSVNRVRLASLSCLVVMIVSCVYLVERSERPGNNSPDLQRRAAIDRRRGPIDRCRRIRAVLSSLSASNSGRRGRGACSRGRPGRAGLRRLRRRPPDGRRPLR